MRYKSFLQNGEWKVYRVKNGLPDGSPIFSHVDKIEADRHIRSLISVDKKSPRRVVTRIAATNEPALPLNRHPIEMTEINGRKYVRVPGLVQGDFTDPRYGDFSIDQTDYDDIEESHILGLTNGPVYLRVGHERNENLAYFDLDRGGFVTQEEVGGDKVLVWYGVPTVPELTEQKIKLYGHASVDYHRQWTSNQLEEPIVFDDRILLQQEDNMLEFTIGGGVTIKYEMVDGKAVIQEEDLEKLKNLQIPEDKSKELAAAQAELTTAQAQLEEAGADKEKLQAKIVKLEEKVKELQPEPEIPEAVRLALEEQEEKFAKREKELRLEIDTRKRNERKARVKEIIAKATAFRDKEGRAHSPALLQLCENVLSLAPVGDGSDVIKLEAPTGPEQFTTYITDALEYMLENVLPGTVPTQQRTNDNTPETDPLDNPDEVQFEEGELAGIWERNWILTQPTNGKED